MKNSDWTLLLEEIANNCDKAPPNELAQERTQIWDTLISIMIYEGLKLCLPEIKEWLKLPTMTLVLFRQKVERRLKEFAIREELDYKKAEKVASRIVSGIDLDILKKAKEANNESTE